ncbi:MAG TPA: efflux RND transporter periplasmic adaptor subunit [Burkholderiales bacterium]|nr:efflux RND transporter periplasmic adaptor subunit [Burkholderiales bacterium]
MDIKPPTVIGSRGGKRLLVAGVASAVGVVVIAAAALIYFGRELRANEPKGGRGPAAVPVSVAMVEQHTVPVRVQAIGNVEAFATVAVKARVDGQIVEVGFKEGEEVPKGRVLFKIDPRPYEAALRQAEANHLRDVAQAEQARSQEKRYQELLQKNFVSKEAYAQIRTNADTAEAVALASRAALDNARLNVEYCTIRSPIEGYAGKIQIQMGNLVKANDVNSLVTINQVHPIYVNFSLPESRLPEVRKYMAAGPLSVNALTPASDKLTAAGTLIFVDNAVDPSTGTIKLRARFQNKENALWPGQFVNVSVQLYQQKDAIIIPSQAVQTGPEGQYVYVVGEDMAVDLRKIQVQRSDGDTAIVASGLAKGERVVTQGQLRLGPKTRVQFGKPGPEAS